MHAPASEDTCQDRAIVALLHAGARERAFETLLARYEGKVYRLCCALLRDRSEAEDAAQESLVRVWTALARYDGRAALSSWIYAITRNRCLTVLQRRRTLGSLDELDGAPQTAQASQAGARQPWDEREQQLRDLVERLPERLRRVLLLYYYEERSVSEVACMLGCPEGTVKTTLFRGRAALSELLKRRGLDDPAYWREDVS